MHEVTAARPPKQTSLSFVVKLIMRNTPNSALVKAAYSNGLYNQKKTQLTSCGLIILDEPPMLSLFPYKIRKTITSNTTKKKQPQTTSKHKKKTLKKIITLVDKNREKPLKLYVVCLHPRVRSTSGKKAQQTSANSRQFCTQRKYSGF